MIWDFLIDNIPSWRIIMILFPLGLIYSFVSLYFSGYLKTKRSWRTGYTRKVFHFLIFSAAAFVQVFAGYEGTIVFGCTVSLAVFFAIWKGEGHLLFEAIAREKDAPRKAYFILAPYLATLAGGLLNNFLYPEAIAIFGYLVTGIGDAIAEPIGTKFGKHKYKVPTAKAVKSYRSIEGSVAVFVGSVCALVLAIMLTGVAVLPLLHLLILVAFIAMLTEAVSPHGWDNFTLQVVTCLCVYHMLPVL